MNDHLSPPDRARQRGNLMLEVAIATVLLAISLTAAAGMIGASLTTSVTSKRINQGARFLEAVLSSLDEQSPEALLAMNGNVFHDRGSPAQSVHRVEVTTGRVGVARIEITLVLRALKTGAEVARVATVRSMP